MISVIVIGRNEGERLRACFQSVERALMGETYELIYVDSHSTDDSLAIARKAGAHCFLPVSRQTTAALGRDIGARAAQGGQLLFLDGDMALEAGFIQEACRIMKDKKYDGACGIRRDIYMKNGQITGENPNYFDCTAPRAVPEFGGALFITRAALEKAGGWATDVEAGEEAELHARLNRCGARIIELPLPMITHTDCVQGERGIAGTIFSRRRLGHGQALRHAIEKRSVKAYITRERALFIPYALDWCALILMIWGVAKGFFAAATIIALAAQAAQMVVFMQHGRIRSYVSAKLFFFALPIGMLIYKRRDTAYCEWTV